MMRRRILFATMTLLAAGTLFLGIATHPARAQAAQTTVASAAAPVASAQPAASAEVAETAPQSAPASYSAASLYNLANSYARAGKPGLAVLNYERASLLAPTDPDIAANLRYVREGAHLPTESKSAWQRALILVNPTGMAFLGLLGVVLLGTALISLERYPARRRLRRAAALIGLVLVGGAAGNACVLWPTLHAAVIVTPTTPVQVSPVPMGDQLFTLPEGETVTIAAEHEDFVLVQTSAGRRGWVARANLVAVVPRGTASRTVGNGGGK